MSRVIVALLMIVAAMPLQAQSVNGVLLKYMVSEPGLEPHPSRIIVTDSMVRMDDGEKEGDYLLFDRRQQRISSVTHEDETIFEISMREVEALSPMELKRERRLRPDDNAPAVGGRRPHQMQLEVNDKTCFDAVVVPGLMPDVVSALREFKRVLAGEQAKLVYELPVEMLEDCDLALHTFYPEWTLESGLSIQELDLSTGRGMLLVDIVEAYPADTQLFVLPEGYRRYHTE